MTYSATQQGKLSREIILEAQKKRENSKKTRKEVSNLFPYLISDLKLLEESKKNQNLRSAIQGGFAEIEIGE